MRKVKKWSTGITLAAVLALVTLTVRTDVAYGAIGIDTTKNDCSITIDLSVDKLVFPEETGGNGGKTPGTGDTSGESGEQTSGTGETTGGSGEQKPEGGTSGESEEPKPGESGEQKPEGENPGGSEEQKPGDTEGNTPEQPPVSQKSPGFEELLELKIDVALYKVADVDVSGKYIPPKQGGTELYNALKGSLDKVNSQTTADEWLSMAEAAMEKIEDLGNLQPVEQVRLNDPNPGDGTTINGLSTGLYLVAAGEVSSSQYIYSFTPYLVSLPGNAYGQDGADDEWIYDVEVSLKPSREPLFGDLKITKSLATFNKTLGGATFIFQIEAKKDDITYSDVKSIVFDAAGTKSITIAEKIPAGAVVTVTEVYSGASYKITSDPKKTETILADKTVEVNFTNDYDERLNGGTSIVNHFVDTAAGEPDGGSTGSDGTDPRQERQPVWEGVQLEDSNAEGGAAADEE